MIKILTRRAGCNYGSILQAYALQQAVEQMGFENRIVDYDEYVWRWKLRPAFYDMQWSLLSLLSPLTKRLMPKKYEFFQNRARQKERFAEFDHAKLNLTEKQCRNGNAIRKDLREGDVCLCGSDQIWSPLLYNPVMFLTFCPPFVPKIAYAPSFGIATLGDKKDLIVRNVSDFHRISIREENGAALLREATGRNDIVQMPDPVFLHDREFWLKLAEQGSSAPKGFILCYLLGKNSLSRQQLEFLKKTTSLPLRLIAMPGNPIDFPGEKIHAATPEDFLALIRDAAFVCTDSFHCTAFSILLRKNFFVCKRFSSQAKDNQNSRISSILEKLELSSQFLDDASACKMNDCRIDYEKRTAALDEIRRTGRSWLQKSIESALNQECKRQKTESR